MRQFKPVIITAIVFIVLAGAVFVASKFMPKTPDELPPGLNTDSNSIYIINKTANAVESINVKTDFGEEFTIDYYSDQNGVRKAKLRNAEPRFKYNLNEMDTLTGYVGILAAIEEIPDANDDKQFGFDKPRRRLSIKYSDGEKINLLLGADSPIGAGMYIKRADTNKVYLIGGSTTEMLMKTLKDYRDLILFGPYNSASDIINVTIDRPDEEPIKIEYSDEKKDDESPIAVQYKLTSPVNAEISNDIVTEKLLDKLIAIKAKALIEDYPKDLKKYGLKDAFHIEFADINDKKTGLTIGDRTENGGRYLMVDDVPSVFETEEDVTFLDLKYTDIIMKLIWIYKSDEVSEIVYTLPGGVTHTLKMDVSGDTYNASYDGGSISRENANNLFLYTIRFTLQGAIDSSMQYGAPEYSIKMTLKNGNVTTLGLARINERQYAAIIDGKPAQYYVNVTEVDELADAFKALQEGRDITPMF